MKDSYIPPIVNFFEKVVNVKNGSYEIDEHGNKYIEMDSSQFCNILGNENQELYNYLNIQAHNLKQSNTEALIKNVLNKDKHLSKISGKLDAYSIYISKGAEVSEFNLINTKLSKKEIALCFNKKYHLLTISAQRFTFSGLFTTKISNIYNVNVFGVSGKCQETHDSLSLRELERIFKDQYESIAAVVFEPVIRIRGKIVHLTEYINTVEDIRVQPILISFINFLDELNMKKIHSSLCDSGGYKKQLLASVILL